VHDTILHDSEEKKSQSTFFYSSGTPVSSPAPATAGTALGRDVFLEGWDCFQSSTCSM
jgi:hypothetical protein